MSDAAQPGRFGPRGTDAIPTALPLDFSIGCFCENARHPSKQRVLQRVGRLALNRRATSPADLSGSMPRGAGRSCLSSIRSQPVCSRAHRRRTSTDCRRERFDRGCRARPGIAAVSAYGPGRRQCRSAQRRAQQPRAWWRQTSRPRAPAWRAATGTPRRQRARSRREDQANRALERHAAQTRTSRGAAARRQLAPCGCGTRARPRRSEWDRSRGCRATSTADARLIHRRTRVPTSRAGSGLSGCRPRQ